MSAFGNLMPEDGTLAYSILAMIAICGDFPANQISRMPGGERYKKEKLKELKSRGLYRVYYRDKLRSYRLTSAAKKLFLANNSSRFGLYLTGKTETNQLKSEIPRRLRLHRIAETSVTMRNADVSIFRDEKPDVFSSEKAEVDSIWVESPAFYSSREIKEYGAEFVKIRNARSVGTLLAEETAFVVYNMGGSRMRWSYKSEMRTKALIKTILLNRLPEQYSPDSIEGLLLGNSMELAFDLLTDKENVKSNYFILDGNYGCFHYLTNDRKGELLLRLLCDPYKKETLNSLLSENFSVRRLGWLFENDAIDDNGAPVIFAYSFDLPKISRFNSAIQLHEQSGTIICFDYQADVLQRYCCSNIKVRTISADEIERRFFP